MTTPSLVYIYPYISNPKDMSLARAFRFTFLSGDVHVAGVARFLSYPRSNLRTDHRFMPQIISSAMGNEPPPDEVVKAVAHSSKTTRLDQVRAGVERQA